MNLSKGHHQLSVRFWGVRGSIACPGPSTLRYGGNTACLEVRCDERLIIFDAGTGIRLLGESLLEHEASPIDADIMLTHTHFDHICGLPFFRPLYQADHFFRIWAGHLLPKQSLHRVLNNMMMDPLFPIPVDMIGCRLHMVDFVAGDILHPDQGIAIKTCFLNHPNGATGYRLNYKGKSLAYVTDTEHYLGLRDPNILELVQDVDVMIYDSTFTDQEYPEYIGWGHSTWQEGVRLADAADVKTLVIFHHDPSHDDAMMDQISNQATKMRPGTLVAQEGMIITI